MRKVTDSPLARRIWEIIGGVSIRVKALGIVLGIILILSGFVVIQMRSVLRERLLLDLERQAAAIAETTAEEVAALLAQEQGDDVHSYLLERQQHYSSASHNTAVAYIQLHDREGALIYAVGADPDAELQRVQPQLPTAADTSFWLSGEVLEVVTDPANADVVVRMGFWQDKIERTVQSVTLQLLLVTTVMVAVGFAAAFLLTWILTRPLLELVQATHSIARGNFAHRVPRWANDEIGELAAAFNTMAASLEEAEQVRAEREALRLRYINGVIGAQENERQRIARELHDSTSQSLTSLLVGLQNLKVSAGESQPGIQAQADELRAIVGQTLDEVRSLSWRLRPSALDDLGLVSALRQYIEEYQVRYGIQVDYTVSGIHERLPSQIETALYRIVQEGLTNIARYAQTPIASVYISRRDGTLRVIVEDNGVGFDPAAVQNGKSLGLQGIRERAGLLGGSLTIESQPGQGTSLFIEIPLQPNQQ